jgi:hypothetical protein
VRFFSKTHGKRHTIAFCTVKGFCRAFFIAHTAKPLCRESNPAHGELTGNGTTDGTGRSPNSSPRLPCASP